MCIRDRRNEKLNAELGLKAEQVEALRDTIDELRDKSLLDSDFEVAVDAMRKGDISVAESIFQGRIDEGNVELEQAHRNLGALNIFINPQKAIEAYREAVRLNPKNADSWVQLGTLLLRTADYDGAMSAYENLSSEADDAGSRIKAVGFVGNVHLNRGELDYAEQKFSEAQKLACESEDHEYMAQAHASLAKVYHQQGEIDDALLHVNKAIDLFPDESEFGLANQYSLKGMLFIDSDLNKAERLVRESLRRFRKIEAPEYIAYQLNNLGTILRRRQEYPDALDCFTEALELHEGTCNRAAAATAKMNIGGVYSSNKLPEKGRDYVCDALFELLEFGNYGRVAEALVNLAGYHRQVGEKERACDLYAYALRLTDHNGLSGLSGTIRSWMAGYCDRSS